MNYNIESVIKRLQNAQKEGKGLINESELISLSTPQINNIDETMGCIDKGIANNTSVYVGYGSTKDYVTLSKAADLTGISRQTLNRWEKDGIITTYQSNHFKRYVFSLKELKETLLLIQKRHL